MVAQSTQSSFTPTMHQPSQDLHIFSGLEERAVHGKLPSRSRSDDWNHSLRRARHIE